MRETSEKKRIGKILLLEAGGAAPMLRRVLEAGDFAVEYARTTGRGISLLESSTQPAQFQDAARPLDAVVMAQWMPDGGTHLLMTLSRDRLPDAPVIILASDLALAVQEFGDCASEILPMDAQISEVLPTVLNRWLAGRKAVPCRLSHETLHPSRARITVRESLRLQVMDRINWLITSNPDAEVALQKSLSLIQAVFQFAGCAVYLAGNSQNELQLIAASGRLSDDESDDLKGWGCPNVKSDLMAGRRQRLAGEDSATGAGIFRYLIPLWRGEEIIGLFKVESLSADTSDETALEIIETFGRQISIALQMTGRFHRLTAAEPKGAALTECEQISSLAQALNNYLMTILGFSSLAQRENILSSIARHHVSQVEEAARKSAVLVGQLLAYSHDQQIFSLPAPENRPPEETHRYQ
jgi:hypothetical protein